MRKDEPSAAAGELFIFDPSCLFLASDNEEKRVFGVVWGVKAGDVG